MSVRDFVNPLFNNTSLVLIGVQIPGRMTDYDFVFINTNEFKKIVDDSIQYAVFTGKEAEARYISFNNQAWKQSLPGYKGQKRTNRVDGLAISYIIHRLISIHNINPKLNLILKVLITDRVNDAHKLLMERERAKQYPKIY